MFKKIQKKWNVNGWQLMLIFCTFALGGSLCARLGKYFLTQLGISGGVQGFVLYILMVFLLWPVCVITISIPLGQFNFFKNYLRRVFRRLTGKKQNQG